MKFVCLGYFDEAAWNAMSPAEQQSFMSKCFAYDDELRDGGHFAGGEALHSVGEAVTVRPREGKAVVTDGPFAETKEHIGGILYLEARDLEEAVALIHKHPGVAAGGFEIRAIDETFHETAKAKLNTV